MSRFDMVMSSISENLGKPDFRNGGGPRGKCHEAPDCELFVNFRRFPAIVRVGSGKCPPKSDSVPLNSLYFDGEFRRTLSSNKRAAGDRSVVRGFKTELVKSHRLDWRRSVSSVSNSSTYIPAGAVHWFSLSLRPGLFLPFLPLSLAVVGILSSGVTQE